MLDSTTQKQEKLKSYYIYALIDPRTNKAFYIGQTVNMKSRLHVHMFNGRKGTGQPVHKVILDMLTEGFTPEMVERDKITTAHKSLALKLEDWWRQKELKAGNIALLNSRSDATCHCYTDFDLYPSKLKALSVATVETVDKFYYDELDRASRYISTLMSIDYEKKSA